VDSAIIKVGKETQNFEKYKLEEKQFKPQFKTQVVFFQVYLKQVVFVFI